MSKTDAEKIQMLIDRQEIHDCLVRYTRGVDRFDRECLLSAYHPDALDDHGVFVGSPEEFADWVFNAHGAGQKATHHILGNHSCEINGNTAHAETTCTYYGWNRDDSIDVVGNRYIDRMEKRNGEWRIADRICVVDWYGALKSPADISPGMSMAMGELMANAHTSRDREDISYQRPLKVVRDRRIPDPLPENS